MHVFRRSPPQRQNSSEDCHRSFHAKRSIASSQLTNCTQFFSRLASRSPPTRVSAYRNRPTGAYTAVLPHAVQCGIKRALFHNEQLIGHETNVHHDAVANASTLWRIICSKRTALLKPAFFGLGERDREPSSRFPESADLRFEELRNDSAYILASDQKDLCSAYPTSLRQNDRW
jgi:hypothetical protein